MFKYLILLAFFSTYLLAQESVEPISPRFIFVKQIDGSYETHMIDHYYASGLRSPKKMKQRLFLYTQDGECVIINNYKNHQLKKTIKSLDHPFDLHGYVINAKDIKTYKKTNQPEKLSCPNETSYEKVQKKAGISKAYLDKWLDLPGEEKPSKKAIEEILKANVFHTNITPYHKTCDEIKDLKEMANFLIKNDYLRMKMNTRDKHYVIPLSTGVGAPYFWDVKYKLHSDKKFQYHERDVEIDLTKKASELMKQGQAIEKEYNDLKQAQLMAMFEKQISENSQKDKKEKNETSKLVKWKPRERNYRDILKKYLPYAWQAFQGAATAQGLIFLSKKNNRIKLWKWIKDHGLTPKDLLKDSLYTALGEFLASGTDPNEIEKKLIENPANLIAAMTEEEEKKACRRVFSNPEAYVSLVGLLGEFEEMIEDLPRYEQLVPAYNAAKVNDKKRSPGKSSTNLDPARETSKVNQN